MKATSSFFAIAVSVTSALSVFAAPVGLQNATATFSQTYVTSFSVGTAINGTTADNLGWAIYPEVGPQTAVFETTLDQGFGEGSILTFTLNHVYALWGQHIIGRFRLSVTTDNRSTFADGLATGGDVDANWVILDPDSFSSLAGATLTKLPDLSILASGTLPNTDIYVVTARTTLTNITGIRLETLPDATLPFGGPGRQSESGNFTLSEFTVDIVPDIIGTNCEPASLGIVSWWQGEGNGADQNGTNDATLEGAAGFAPGVVGQGFSFQGPTSRALVADSPSLRFTNAMTVEAWIYPNPGSGRYREILSKWEGGSNQRSYTFNIQPNGKGNFAVNASGGISSVPAFTVSSIPTNTWSHLAGVYDGSSVRIYLNGVLEGSVPHSQGIFPGTAPLVIGSTLLSGSYFDGLIDELTVYKYALSGTEIRSIYLAGSYGKCPPLLPPQILMPPTGQVGYWGGSVSFQVKSSTNNPPVMYQWYFEGFLIPWATNATLALNNLSFTDAGDYWVVVSNSVDSIISPPARLVVNPAGVGIGLYPGLSITGTVGKAFGIQYSTNVSQTNNWTSLGAVTLTETNQLWFDTNANVSSGIHPKRFYRVVPLP